MDKIVINLDEARKESLKNYLANYYQMKKAYPVWKLKREFNIFNEPENGI